MTQVGVMGSIPNTENKKKEKRRKKLSNLWVIYGLFYLQGNQLTYIDQST
jgi:hypothetical protein